MPLKTKNLKFITKSYVLGFCFFTTLSSFSQEIIEETVEVEAPKAQPLLIQFNVSSSMVLLRSLVTL